MKTVNLRTLNTFAASRGLIRAKGLFNGAAYWRNASGQIVSRGMLEDRYFGFAV